MNDRAGWARPEWSGRKRTHSLEGRRPNVRLPEEHHHREQYFFDGQTLGELANFIGLFQSPCCLCAPMLGRELHHRGRKVAVLDVDQRFGDLPGFVEWDLYRPKHLDQEFDLIVCNPPFFKVSLSQLFTAVRLLCHFNLTRQVMISYPLRRRNAILGTFAPFNLAPTGYRPGYLTVRQCEKNDIEFYANFDLPSPVPRFVNPTANLFSSVSSASPW